MSDSKAPTPLVSCILIFYNEERFLEEAIESVLAQSYERWELLLVDDGSTDRSPEVARYYAETHPDRITYLQHPGGENRGACASRNLGLRHAQGSYVAPLDADDVWTREKLSDQVALMEAHPKAGMICGATKYWHSWSDEADKKDRILEVGAPPGLYDPPVLLTRLYPLGSGTAPCPSVLLIRRFAVERVGGFEEAFRGKYQVYEDQAFLAKLYLNESVLISDSCWAKYRQHENSCVAVSLREGTHAEARKYFLEWLVAYLKKEGYPNMAVRAALWKVLWPHRYPRLRYLFERSRHFYNRFRQKAKRYTKRLMPTGSSVEKPS